MTNSPLDDRRAALAGFDVSDDTLTLVGSPKPEGTAPVDLSVGTAVIGAGVIGLAVASRLAEEGGDVLVVEGGSPRFGTSLANAGHMVSSDVLPFAHPGMVMTGLESLIRGGGVFGVNGRHLYTVLPWLVGFARSCSEANVRRAAPAISWLGVTNARELEQLSERSGLPLRSGGLLEVFYSTRSLDKGRLHAERIRGLGVKSEEVAVDELMSSSPLLSLRPVGAVRLLDDLSADPLLLWRALKSEAAAKGAGLLPATVRSIVPGASSVRLVTDNGTVRADNVVVAAGAWSGALARQVGVRVRLAAAKGYSVTLEHPRDAISDAMILMDPHVAVNSFEQGLRISSRYEVTAPEDRKLHAWRVNQLLRVASKYLRIGDHPDVRYSWTGNRPAMSDGFPVIGAVPSCPRVILCSGHGMLGSSTALSSALMVADLVAGRPISRELMVLAPTRA